MGPLLILYAIIVGVVINLTLPMIALKLATTEQITPPNGADKLGFFDQLMHMFVHHAQVPLTSSIIIAVIVGLSVSLALLVMDHI